MNVCNCGMHELSSACDEVVLQTVQPNKNVTIKQKCCQIKCGILQQITLKNK